MDIIRAASPIYFVSEANVISGLAVLTEQSDKTQGWVMVAGPTNLNVGNVPPQNISFDDFVAAVGGYTDYHAACVAATEFALDREQHELQEMFG